MSDKFLCLYDMVQERKLGPPFDREVKIRLRLGLLGHDGLNHSTPVFMRALVSPVEHNLLSVGQVARQGSTFSMDPPGCKLSMKDRKMFAVLWGSCPWIKALEESHEDSGFNSHSSSRGGRRKVRVQWRARGLVEQRIHSLWRAPPPRFRVLAFLIERHSIPAYRCDGPTESHWHGNRHLEAKCRSLSSEGP